ncbi:MFS transporter [Bacillus sp. CECT 9360]|uniref:MDR family MFS transporter n=1 Tax=Bacillus sp. CECT 9360 TaxID=2845821 RepID=UPI001E4EB5E1|nr:MFS transporter [Bacillus sp. CECT 9360]CAH0345213.1 Na(+), Li(+), K(+)/H(+) antiporter [Bacillus sp. CECT 9360]
MRLKDWDNNLKVRLGGESLVNITFWMFFPFLAIFFTESFGKTTAGLLLVFSQVFSVVANLLGGFFADRFGRKKMMVISSIGQGVSFLVFAYASSPWYNSPLLGFVCFTAVSIFGSLYWPASQAMVADVVSEKDRSSVFAIFYTSTNIAVVIGPILGGIFYADHRFELLLAAGVLNALLGFVLYKWISETSPAYKAHAVSADNMNWLRFLLHQLQDYKVILQDKTFLLFILAGVLVAQTFMQLELLIPVYVKETIEPQTLFAIADWSLDLEGEQIFGFLIAENGFLVALLTIVITKWMSVYKEKNVFVLSSFIYGGSMLMFGLTSWIWGLILAMAVFTFAELMTAGIQQGFISKLAPDNMRGQYFAAASLRYTIGRMVAPLAIPMSEWMGYFSTFVTLCVLACLSSVLFAVMFKRFEINQAV